MEGKEVIAIKQNKKLEEGNWTGYYKAEKSFLSPENWKEGC